MFEVLDLHLSQLVLSQWSAIFDDLSNKRGDVKLLVKEHPSEVASAGLPGAAPGVKPRQVHLVVKAVGTDAAVNMAQKCVVFSIPLLKHLPYATLPAPEFSTTLLAPHCLHHPTGTTLPAPLCLHHCAYTTLHAPLWLHRPCIALSQSACIALLASLFLHRSACAAILAPRLSWHVARSAVFDRVDTGCLIVRFGAVQKVHDPRH